DAAILAHREVFGMGDAPEMAAVPFVLAKGNAVAVFLKEMLVGLVTVGALPAAEFHEVAAEFLFALKEGRALDTAARSIGLACVHGGEVDLLGVLVGPSLDEFFFQLVRVEAGIVDRIVVDRGAAVRHPVGDQLGVAGAVLHPDGDAIPQAAYLLALAAGRA